MNKDQAKFVHDKIHEVVFAREQTANPTMNEVELRAWVNYFMRLYIKQKHERSRNNQQN